MTTPPPVYNGRYELRNQIARGGTAQVYLARDLVLDRLVALKVLFPELSTDHSFVERFRREAQAAANLSHANIVPVFDWGESESTYFIVMEYVDGEPLSSIIRTQAPLPPLQAATVAAGIAKALSYAHRHGVVHRDVKPGNVLITADGQVKVTDFGIARAIGSDEQVTQTGLVMGTATYFSPEQAQGLPVDARSDVYALGVVLYEMLAGRPPFTGENPVAIAYQHVREQPPPLRSLVPDIPPALEAIVAQAMAKLPAERYPTAHDMQADLERFVRGQTVMARPPTGTGGQTTGQTGLIAPLPETGLLPGAAAPPAEVRPRRTTWRWATAAVLLLCAIGACAFYGGRELGYFGGSKWFDEPNVAGKPEGTAKQQLAAKGLVVQIQAVSSSRGAAGIVVGQTPAPGESVRAKDVVVLQVPNPPPNQPVPVVVGDAYSAARSKLIAAGFGVLLKIQKQTRFDQNNLQGTVLFESPQGRQPPKTVITLTVMSGAAGTPIPDVGGDTVAEASSTLTTAGFKVNPNPDEVLSPSVPAGDVVSTSPPAGDKQLLGLVITLNVAENSVTVPDLSGNTVQQAESDLINDHLVPGLVRTVAPSVPGCAGYVCYTNPATGTNVAWGTKVGIFEGTPPVAPTTTAAPTTTSPPTSAPTTPTTTMPPGTSGQTGSTGTGASGFTGASGNSGSTGATASGPTAGGAGVTGASGGTGTDGNAGSSGATKTAAAVAVQGGAGGNGTGGNATNGPGASLGTGLGGAAGAGSDPGTGSGPGHAANQTVAGGRPNRGGLLQREGRRERHGGFRRY